MRTEGLGGDPDHRCWVLVADDDPDIRETLVEMLIDEGWCVAQAKDGSEALRHMMSAEFDAVILDNRMPVLTGSEAYKLAVAGGRRAPVILVTAAAEIESLAASLDVPHFLAKPFDVDELVAYLAHVAPGCPRERGGTAA